MVKDDSDYEDGEFDDEAYNFDDGDDQDRPRKKLDGDYHLTNVLKLPRATTYSTQALYDQVHAGDIDLEPEYQRDVVWPESKQIGLIDSILRNFYVPPIIFVAHQHDDGSETKTCIDGKQRLTSIHRFMDGLIPHRDSNTGTKFWFKAGATQNSRKQLLPERYRRLFANKQIVCVEYQELSDTDEREIFQRVQLGMALTPAEKLQVTNSPMATFVRKLQSEYFNSGSALDSENFEWDRSRGGDFRCITQALYLIAKYPSSASIGAIPQLEKWLQRPTVKPYTRSKSKKKAAEDDGKDLSSDTAFLERIHDTFHTFSKLVGDPVLQPLFLKPEWRVSPIEFVMMSLLVAAIKDSTSAHALATKIGDMRMRVRSEHLDVRMNSRVARTMFDFIQESSETSHAEGGVGNAKRKREEQDVGLGRKEKERRGTSSVTLSTPKPDRLLPLREAKVIPPPRATQAKASTIPVTLQ